MDKYDKISLIASKNDVTDNVHKIDTILYEAEVPDNTATKEIKSQLLSLDGWKNFQKELIQLCFEFWEVNETHAQVNNSLQSDLKTSDSAEMLLPSSLFADEKNIDFNSKSYGVDGFSKEFQNRDGSEANGHFSKNQHEADPAVVNRRFSKVINNDINLKTHENCSKSFDIRGNRAQIKKLKKFSFYKHMSNQGKPKTKLQSVNFEMLDTVKKTRKYYPSILPDTMRCDNMGEYVDETENNNNTCAAKYSLADVEEKQMEEKVKKLIKSLKEKDKLFTGISANDQATKFGSSNKLKYFFKNAFRGTQDDELDLQLLDDYTKYINNKVHTWQTLLHCLEDIRQKEGCKTKTDPSEDTIKRCKFRRDHEDIKKAKDDCDVNNCSKYVEFNDDGFDGTGKRRKKGFLNLLNKTTKRREPRSNAADGVRAVNSRRPSSNRFDSDAKDETDATLSRDGYRKRVELQIRKSLSETDLSAMVLHYDETKAVVVKNGMMAMQLDGKTSEAGLSVAGDEYDYFQWDDRTCRGLWEERQECFRTAVARLEYVGSTLKEHCQLAGLKTLCKVDVLAGFGHSAEAVDLFVSVLPMSDNPGLMIRKAEAAYDWKFFCHLSMWRHSYKD